MPFTPGSIATKYTDTTNSSSGFVPGSVANKYSTKTQSTGFQSGSIASKYATSSAKDTQSSQGLYNLAVNSGLKNDADRIMASQAGEQTKQIFSGGFISDIFDVLNAFDYGVVGLLKGKSFMEGVKTRQSFTDKDALGDKGLPGIILGTALDIAVDPLTYIAPTTILKKVPFASKLLTGAKELVFGKAVEKAIQGTDKTYQAIEGGTRAGKYLASKVGWMFGADPVFKETFERSAKNIAVDTMNITELGKATSALAPETAAKLLTKDETGRFMRTSLDVLKKTLKPDELEPVSKFYNKIDELGKQAVDLGLLSKDTFEENVGQYIKNAYTEYELGKGKGFFGSIKTGIKGIKNRVEGLTPEKMKELGQIDNPAYLLFKSAFDLTKDVENAKLLKTVADKFGTDVAQEGFTQIASGKKWGTLAGKYIPSNMAEYLTEVIEPSANTATKNLIANFKFFKVIMNPGTHARNVASNTLLNWWKLGLGPWRADVYGEALKNVIKGGKWADEAKTVGYNLDTFASAEMKHLLDSPEAITWGKKLGGTWQKTKQFLGDIYQKEENVAKLAAFIQQRKKGLGIEEAWKAAESATFNYAQVTPFVRKLRESIFGFPFITFTVKSTPVVAETIVKNPNRISIIGKIKNSIENLADLKETDRERASEPSWVKDGFYIKLPMKDKQGRSAYFDLTYILPFGDLISGNIFERGTKRDTNLPDNQIIALAKKSPFINLVTELGKNQDFYGNKIWQDSDSSEKQMGDLMRHIAKSYLPPMVADQLPGGYDKNGERVNKGIIGGITADKENQQRTLMQELLRQVGAKVQPVDADVQETYQEWNKRKALETLLMENGKLKSFSRSYIPKK